jgi:uncharacterized damage-inducible protein DinB
MTTDPRYPVGKFESRTELTQDERRGMIDTIAAAPVRLREAVRGLTEEQLDTPYRDGGWTVRQVIHHVPDSHLNAYIRTKLALTEDVPNIKPYDEAVWAELEDSRSTPPEVSLTLLESLQARWVVLLRSLSEADFKRTFRHPEHGGIQTIDWLVALYSWHGRHHVGHITSLRERNGW